MITKYNSKLVTIDCLLLALHQRSIYWTVIHPNPQSVRCYAFAIKFGSDHQTT